VTAVTPTVTRVADSLRATVGRATDAFHGLRHGGTVFVLAAVFALDEADKASIGAMAPSLKHAFHISNSDIGLLAGAFSVVGGLATLPMGILTDRMRRHLLLSASVVVWSIAMGATGLAVTFTMLFIARLGLGIVTAAAGPTVASLTGDLFPPRRRARILSYIETGEMVGTGLGFIATGAIVALLSWRWVFHLLAVVGVVVAYSAWRIPEPERGAQGGEGRDTEGGPDDRHVVQVLREEGVEPNEDVVLDEEPRDLSLWSATRHVLRVRTNVIAIVAVTIGNFWFAGLRTFSVIFVVAQYGIANSTAALLIPVVGVGAVAGLLLGGRMGDALLRRGRVNGRIEVGAAGYCAAPLFILPALFTHSSAIALPLLVGGALALTVPTAPLDAARLDIMPPGLWGRAEGIRTTARVAGEAAAPILFGFLADNLAGGGRAGIQLTFAVMLPALIASGLVVLKARRSYGPDVLAAAESD
jgi:predicted MFS family arabinose efflux permease